MPSKVHEDLVAELVAGGCRTLGFMGAARKLLAVYEPEEFKTQGSDGNDLPTLRPDAWIMDGETAIAYEVECSNPLESWRLSDYAFAWFVFDAVSVEPDLRLILVDRHGARTEIDLPSLYLYVSRFKLIPARIRTKIFAIEDGSCRANPGCCFWSVDQLLDMREDVKRSARLAVNSINHLLAEGALLDGDVHPATM
jgi:hypothetical protein